MSSREPLPNAFALARGEETPSDPIEFVRDEGRLTCDLIGTTHAILVLVSERFLDALREGDFTGWTTFPVRVLLDDEKELEGYHGFAVTGRCGAIDDSLSEQIMRAPPVPSGRPRPALRGVCFPPDSWDGSDVFTPEGYTGVFVVERVKHALEAAGVTNLEFRRLSEIERIWRADRSVIRAE